MKNFDEKLLAIGIVIIATIFVSINNFTLPPTLDGMSQAVAIQDTMGLKIVQMAILDMHTALLIYLIGGHTFKTIKEMTTTAIGKVALGIVIAAWILGTALVLAI